MTASSTLGSSGPATPLGAVRPDAGRALAVLILFYVLNAFDRTVLSLMVTPAKRDLGLSDSQLGLILGLGFALFYALCSIPFGMLVDRMSRRNLLWFGVTIWSAATIACTFCQNFEQLLVARMVLGLGEASLSPAAVSILADEFDEHRLGRAMSTFVAGGLVGNSIAIALGGVAVTHFDKWQWIELPVIGAVRGWQLPFLLIGLPGIVLAPLARSFREPVRRGSTNMSAQPLLPALGRRKRVLTSFFFTYIILGMLLYAGNLWMPTYMIRRFGWTAAQAGPALGLVTLVFTGGGTLAAGFIVDHVTRAGFPDAAFRVLFWSLLVAAPAGIIAFEMSNPIGFLITYAIFSLFGLSFAGYGYASLQSISPGDTRGRFAALFLLLQILVGAGIGPSLIGLLSDRAFSGPGSIGTALTSLYIVVIPIAAFTAWFSRRALIDAASMTNTENRYAGLNSRQPLRSAPTAEKLEDDR